MSHQVCWYQEWLEIQSHEGNGVSTSALSDSVLGLYMEIIGPGVVSEEQEEMYLRDTLRLE